MEPAVRSPPTVSRWERAVFASFMLVIGTAVGPYSTRLGPFFMVYLVGIVAWVTWRHVNTAGAVLLRPSTIVGAAIFLIPVIAMLLSEDRFEKAEYLAVVVSLLTLYIAIVYSAAPGFGPLVVRWSIILALLASAINVYEFVISPDVLSIAPGRAAGFFENPNNAAVAIAGFYGVWFAQRRSRVTLFDWLISSLAFLGVLCTFSRSGMLLFAMLFVVLFAERSWHFGVSRSSLVAGAVAVVVMAELIMQLSSSSVLDENAVVRLHSVLTGDFSDEAALLRSAVRKEYLAMFWDNFWLGRGAMFSLRAPTMYGPHDQYLAVAVDFGIGGLVAYGALLLRLFGEMLPGRRHNPYRSAVIAIAIWLAVSSFFSHNLTTLTSSVAVIGIGIGLLSSGARWRAA